MARALSKSTARHRTPPLPVTRQRDAVDVQEYPFSGTRPAIAWLRGSRTRARSMRSILIFGGRSPLCWLRVLTSQLTSREARTYRAAPKTARKSADDDPPLSESQPQSTLRTGFPVVSQVMPRVSPDQDSTGDQKVR